MQASGFRATDQAPGRNPSTSRGVGAGIATNIAQETTVDLSLAARSFETEAVPAGFGTEEVTVKASLRKGSKLVRVAKASKSIGQNKTVTIKLKLSKKSLAKVLAALTAPNAKGKAKIKVTVTVTGTDAAGNKRTISKTVVVK